MLKKIAFTLFIYLIINNLAIAQNPNFQNRSAEEIAERQTKIMKDSLNLTEEQLPKVKAINLKYAEKMKELMSSEADQLTKMQDFQVLQSNREYEMKKVLTKDQGKLFTAMQERQRARMRERRQNNKE
jgi:Spy/CpxP family protein refolding chaperone